MQIGSNYTIRSRLQNSQFFSQTRLSVIERLPPVSLSVFKANRIDATVIDKTSKQVRVIEMSCPGLENRESKDFEKPTKYSQLRLELTNRYPGYKVNQYNIIMDVLGGCSKEVEKNIKELVGDKCESIMRQMQKAILSSSLHIARMFKLSA